ncbi:MAG: hypothetical protein J6M30_09620 [Bacteroidales bacterium]|nr:hypothetical protein [Bacteroidales bacterium]MBP3254748.1 hypothetical protein [Bacteroidales bacterium]
MVNGCITLTLGNKATNGTVIDLPYSKSISNRLLIINFLSGKDIASRENFSDADDTELLYNILQHVKYKTENSFHCKNAGTSTRFLIALLSLCEGTWYLNADRRMQQRPLLPLIEILTRLGADINVAGNGKIFPLRICGKKLQCTQTIKTDCTLTSQIVSALLLISPYLENGMKILLPENQSSVSYINMTISAVNAFNGNITKVNNLLISKPSQYKFRDIATEWDYPSACFFYLYTAVGKLTNLRINHLHPSSLQGESIAGELFLKLGVETVFDSFGAILNYNETLIDPNAELVFDTGDCPDIFIALATACFLSGRKTTITNLAPQRLKESDRLSSTVKELNKAENRCSIIGDSLFIEKRTALNCNKNLKESVICFSSYNDHRIAMALCAFAFVCKRIEIDNPSCTEKSFPHFWEQAEKLFVLN